jgi:hypothetical protein
MRDFERRIHYRNIPMKVGNIRPARRSRPDADRPGAGIDE